ncbi:MAG: FKBP-type peptidyl-prolyl cis-trans isomerase [Phaeodactylibacter sp.]|nr:FKBP-type peptidyl-prolyl cis-trans isomerase [Phaeodactylibacter sp.]MCB9048084.1 FKBP-type peptidyl-prolyl cis-trans isomerase [Lewinellaceae bacterium]
MIVEEQNIITIAYELREGGSDGELLERMDANYPFKFYFGSGRLLPAFEQHLEGLEEGQPFEFILPPEQAYGPVDPRNIIGVPREAFRHLGDNVLVKDNFITLTDDNGEAHNGRILSWTEDMVQVDFNHAMAGKTLHFSGVVLNIRNATVDELIRKNYVEEDGVRGWEEEL